MPALMTKESGDDDSPMKDNNNDTNQCNQTEDENFPVARRRSTRQKTITKATRSKRKVPSRKSASKALRKIKEEEEGEDGTHEKQKSSSNAKDGDKSQDEEYNQNFKDKVENQTDDEADENPRKRRKRSNKSFTCPHCGKEFSSEGGLRYHIDNYVCRMDQCKDPKILVKLNTKKMGRGKSKKNKTAYTPSSKRFRGKLEDRTCPHCKRVFTSILGANYHISRKVCQQASKFNDKKMVFHNLQPGERFMTSFGVVEVISDDRETSTAPMEKIPPSKTRTHKSKVESQRRKMIVSKYSRLRARKYKINALMESGNPVNKASIFYAYYGDDPTKLNENKEVNPMPAKVSDVYAPPKSFPDRIVECIWLQPDGSAPSNPFSAQRLFLQRRLLTEPYVRSGNLHACEDCGRKFTSTPGYKYHINHRVCLSRTAKMAEARKARDKMVEVGASFIIKKKYCPPEYNDSKPDFTPRPAGVKKKKKGKKKKMLGMYPEVVISLGYRVIKENMSFTDDMLFQPLEAAQFDINAPYTRNTWKTVDPPDMIMHNLKKNLVERQRLSDDQKYGCMYKEVYKALGFKKPRKRNGIGSNLRRKRAKVMKPPPPIIDISALADEVDSGRYPSKKRYDGDDHTDVCVICKEGGTLLCCDFCKNAVHMHCMCEKFTIKTPEPDEDFMCHKCIQLIMARRKRAEGRRLKKQERVDKDNKNIERQNPDIKVGMEYEQLASVGQEYCELIELLQDARQRLRQSLATSTMNDIRRKLIRFD